MRKFTRRILLTLKCWGDGDVKITFPQTDDLAKETPFHSQKTDPTVKTTFVALSMLSLGTNLSAMNPQQIDKNYLPDGTGRIMFASCSCTVS